MFPTFPDFGTLSLDHKEDYERLVAEYPPFSDISFATLHIWWNLEDKLGLSILNNNLVINYQLPFDAGNSGFCLVGKHDIDASIQTIFAQQRSAGQEPKLVHVPEFVVEAIADSNKLSLSEEIDYNEYLFDSQAMSSLEGSLHRRTRQDVNHFLRDVENRKVEFRELELTDPQVQQELFDAIISWEQTHEANNDPSRDEHQAIQKTLDNAQRFGIRHVGLYIDDKLSGIVLYHRPMGKEYFIMHHLKVDYSIPYIFDYLTHHVANQAVKEDIAFINMEMDLGIEGLRNHKTRLRPVDFFRKYTITPAKE